jgi:hypothetical protein
MHIFHDFPITCPFLAYFPYFLKNEMILVSSCLSIPLTPESHIPLPGNGSVKTFPRHGIRTLEAVLYVVRVV